MKKWFSGVLATLCMVVALLPVTAWAAPASSVYVGGVELNATYPYLVNGAVADAGTPGSGGCTAHFLTSDGTSTLILNGANITTAYERAYSGRKCAIYSNGDLEIALQGANSVTCPDAGGNSSYGVYVESGSLTISGDGSLTATGGSGLHSCGVRADHSVVIVGGANVNATGGRAAGHSYGVYVGNESVSISGNATLNASGSEAGNDSSFGVYAYASINISGGTVESTGGTALKSYGMFAYTDRVNISGGTVTAKSTSADATGTAQAMNKAPDLSGYSTAHHVLASSDSSGAGAAVTTLNDTDIGTYRYARVVPGTAPLSFTDSASYDVPAGTVTTAITPIDVSEGASGGTASYIFSFESGAPSWISISSSGVITGTRPATAQAETTATVKVTDNASASRTITIAVGAVTAPTTYTVTVNRSYAVSSGAGSYEENAPVSIDAGSRSDYTFSGWTLPGGTVTFADASSAITTFIMPASDVTLTANWSYIGGGSSGPSYDYYTVTAVAGDGGTISPSGRVSAREGRSKTFAIAPDEGYVIDHVLVDGVSTGAVSEYTFKDIQERHNIEAVFAEDININPNAGAWDNPFADVSEDDWYYEYVRYVHEQALMQGKATDQFFPETPTDRGMIVTVLWRLEGEPEAAKPMSFTDVAEGDYYHQAIAWAAENKIVEGYSATSFGPEDDITREQLAAIFYRYAEYKENDVSSRNDLSAFNDQPSSWAVEYMQWAVAEGLLQGKGDGIIDPLAGAERCESAAILKRFVERYE